MFSAYHCQKVSRMKKLLIVIAVIVVGYLAIVGLGYSAQEYQVNSGSSKINPATAKNEFMLSCNDGSMNGARFNQELYCGCMWTELTNVFGIDGLAKDGLNLTQDEMVSKYRSYGVYCLGQQGIEV